jgi:signal transduction histidine kinase
MAIGDAELRTRAAEQALLAVARLVAAGAQDEALFTPACEQVVAATGATTASVLRYVGDERAVAVGTWRREGVRGVPVNAELDFDPTNSALGRVRATGRPSRVDSYEGAGGELPVVMRSIGLRSTIAAPILVRGGVWGALVAPTDSEEPFPAGSEDGLADFAELLAFAVARVDENRSLADAQVRLVEAADASRRRLERRLHEGPHQHLVSLALKLRVARAKADPAVAALIDEALTEALATTAALRDVSRTLHPAVLGERGLAPALLALASRSGVPVHLRELPGRRYPPALETTVYQFVAEAIAEAARQLEVRVADGGDHVLVEIHDGVTEPRLSPALRQVADRAAALGGTLEPAGDRLRLTLPL